MKRNWLTLNFLICAMAPLIAHEGPVKKRRPEISASHTAPRFDANLLCLGRFVYRDMKQGKEVARFALTIRRMVDGSFRFAGDATGFNQHWESAANPAFEPISAALQLQRANGESYAMSLNYNEGRVTGNSITTTSSEKSSSVRKERVIDASVPTGTVDQRIDWAAVLSGSLEPGQDRSFTVYDPETGVSHVSVKVGKAERVHVPAGIYETVRVIYRIEKPQGTESYEILASKQTPRVMIREEFPNGMVSELAEISAADNGLMR
ncbi:MAG TPA: hypothetical protein VKC60_15150 [Opitutaceae bacterium]|nr:hypothetical protein [Opitutaceae bacterium]